MVYHTVATTCESHERSDMEKSGVLAKKSNAVVYETLVSVPKKVCGLNRNGGYQRYEALHPSGCAYQRYVTLGVTRGTRSATYPVATTSLRKSKNKDSSPAVNDL